MKMIVNRNYSRFSTYDELMNADIWKAEHIGLKPDMVSGTYQLNFSNLKPTWLKVVVKRFIRFQASTKSFASCFSYLGRLKHFGEFLTDNVPGITPSQINRALSLRYIEYLSQTKLGTVTRSMALIHLRTLHGIILQEKWLPWPNEPLIYSTDIPKLPQKIGSPNIYGEIRHVWKLDLFIDYAV